MRFLAELQQDKGRDKFDQERRLCLDNMGRKLQECIQLVEVHLAETEVHLGDFLLVRGRDERVEAGLAVGDSHLAVVVVEDIHRLAAAVVHHLAAEDIRHLVAEAAE
ncbi:Hypothetical predicted protein, partial [Cloeon dipterum]